MIAAALIAFALVGAPSGDELAWQKLQRGMTVVQVNESLGAPLLRNAARGHEVWIYDAGAQVQFHGGTLTAWTAPKRKLARTNVAANTKTAAADTIAATPHARARASEPRS